MDPPWPGKVVLRLIWGMWSKPCPSSLSMAASVFSSDVSYGIKRNVDAVCV